MSIYESSITNPKKQLEFYKDLSEKLQQENEKLHHYKTLYQSLKRQKEELRDYLKARIEVCNNRLSMPFRNPENATKERLTLSQCLEKMEELEGVSNEWDFRLLKKE